MQRRKKHKWFTPGGYQGTKNEAQAVKSRARMGKSVIYQVGSEHIDGLLCCCHAGLMAADLRHANTTSIKAADKLSICCASAEICLPDLHLPVQRGFAPTPWSQYFVKSRLGHQTKQVAFAPKHLISHASFWLSFHVFLVRNSELSSGGQSWHRGHHSANYFSSVCVCLCASVFMQ